tara:strand:+ start:30102 stop:30257 length:156 start_codon:yes stop_codon:yes gene_type:complete
MKTMLYTYLIVIGFYKNKQVDAIGKRFNHNYINEDYLKQKYGIKRKPQASL